MKKLEDYNESTLKVSFTLINFLHFNLGGLEATIALSPNAGEGTL